LNARAQELTATLETLRQAEDAWQKWSTLEVLRRTPDGRGDRTLARMTDRYRREAYALTADVVATRPDGALLDQVQARIGAFRSAYTNRHREPMGETALVHLVLEELAGALVLLRIWETKRHG
jgi:hypothetical protein